jgi:hypothetical protein
MNMLKYQHLFAERGEGEDGEAPGNSLQDKATPGRRYAASVQPHDAISPASHVPQPAAGPEQPTPKHHGSQTRKVHQVSGYLNDAEFAEVERLRRTGTNELTRGAVVTKLIRSGLNATRDNEQAEMLEPRIEQMMTRLFAAFVNRFMRVMAQTYYTAKAGDIKLTDLMSLAYGSNTAEFHQKVADAEKEARLSLSTQTKTEEKHPSLTGMREESQTRE